MRALPLNTQKHSFIMSKILLAIFQDKELNLLLAFKGGTSLMFFYDLPRFSTDLDFNLLDETKTERVCRKLKSILLRFGTITDEAEKFYDPIFVLDYGKGERKLKVEVSTRFYDNHYELHSMAGTDIRVMTSPDMFAHKLCALGERATPRDLFDIWFFLKHNCEINENIVWLRTGRTVKDYAHNCAERVKMLSAKELMQGLGEVVDNRQKGFVRNNLIVETATLLELFSDFPLIAQQPMTARMKLIDDYPDIVRQLNGKDVDLSTLSEQTLQRILAANEAVELTTKHAQKTMFRFERPQL